MSNSANLDTDPSVPPTVNGYTVLPVLLPATPTAPAATHYMYLRRHEPKLPTPDSDRSIFAANLPIDATEDQLRSLFASVDGGRVERVIFEGDPVIAQAVIMSQDQKKNKKRKRGEDEADEGSVNTELPKVWGRTVRRSGGTAVVVFVDRASMQLALKGAGKILKKGKKAVEWPEHVGEREGNFGVQRYITHHSLTFPPAQDLQSTIDAFMASFAEKEALRTAQLARMRNMVDEDGFTLVVRGGRGAGGGGVRQEEAQAALERKSREAEEKDKANIGFYRFQTREGKKEAAKRLLERFEEDKRRVAERKAARRFKPL